MRFKKGSSDKVVAKNIEMLVEEGFPRNRAIAIAMDEAGISTKFGEKEMDEQRMMMKKREMKKEMGKRHG